MKRLFFYLFGAACAVAAAQDFKCPPDTSLVELTSERTGRTLKFCQINKGGKLLKHGPEFIYDGKGKLVEQNTYAEDVKISPPKRPELSGDTVTKETKNAGTGGRKITITTTKIVVDDGKTTTTTVTNVIEDDGKGAPFGNLWSENLKQFSPDIQDMLKKHQHMYPISHFHQRHEHNQSGANKKYYDPEARLDKRGDVIDVNKEQDILSKEKNAVVHIMVYSTSGAAYSTGAGTMVTKDGHVITNYHVAKPFIENSTYSVEFSLPDGRKATNFIVMDCDGKDNLDLCLIKTDLKPTHWFSGVQSALPAYGEKLYMIGHPSGNLWDLRAGMSLAKTVDIRRNGSTRLEVTVPVRPGFSGGPIFNQQGELVCLASDRVVSNIRYPSKDKLRHFCVEGHKIHDYLDRANLL